jgi:hypothetical protein
MNRTLKILGVLLPIGTALAVTSASATPAEASRGHRHAHSHHHHHHFRHRHVPFVFYSGTTASCSSYWWQWKHTGRLFWYNKYLVCKGY